LPKSYEEVVKLHEELEQEYMERHDDFRRLRAFWQGKYWDEVQSSSQGVSSIFRDLIGNKSDVGPDIKLVNNVLQQVCVKFQTYLSPLPMIQVPVDPPESQHRKNQATLKERYLYACWWENRMNKEAIDIGWYLPLFGDCYHGIFPDLDRNVPRSIVRSPEYAYPIPSFDKRGEDGVIFAWDVRESALKRAFPKYVSRADRGLKRKRGEGDDPEVKLMEYSDGDEWTRWADGVKMNGVEHNWGWNLFEHVKFIDVPDEVWGHGAVEQAVNLVEMGNALYSLLFQAVFENVFPRIALINPSKAPEELDMGPGAVWGINEGGDVKQLAPPVQALPTQVGFLAENERAIKQATSMPDVNFGNMNASVITGKAINELQGAGTGSVVEMVQSAGIGASFEAWNEKAIYLAQTMFKNEQLKMYGVQPASVFDIRGTKFGFNAKGKELIGSNRNILTFSPYIGQHEKLVMGLQMLGGGVASKRYVRDQVGIPDTEAMDEEIVTEAIQEAVLGAIVQQMTDPADAQQVEEQVLAYLNGQAVPPMPQAPALPNQGGPGDASTGPGGFPVGPIAPGASGQAFSPALPLPAGSPTPTPPPQPQGGSEAGVTLDDAIQAFQGVNGVTGRVFLVGEIVQRGMTQDDIEVVITDASDRQVLVDGLPQYAGILVFHHVSDEPQEAHVEVTPGAEVVQGGASPDLSFIQ
jgi:hypothetical protein